MHNHECKYCREIFACGEGAECSKDLIVCQDCLVNVEFKYYLLFIALAVVAVAMTLFLFGALR